MGAGGFRKNTGRNNTTLPYNVGFLNRVEDTETYNTAVYDELQKVSTATNQMFQAIDEIHDEIDVRIKALNAMNLQFDELENRITTEIETAIADIQTQMGNLSTDDIWDNSTNPPTKLNGTVAGIKTSIEGNDLKIQTVQGIVNEQGQEIALVQTELTTQGQKIVDVDGRVTTVQNSLSQYMKLTEYEATWGVNSSVNGRYAGVKLTNNGTNSAFQVTAQKFIVGDGSSGNTPFVFENGRARMEFADIKNVNITTAMIANARIQFAQIDNVWIQDGQIANLTANKITAGSMSGSNWRLTVGGDFVMGGTGGAQLWMNGNRIDFYDGSGALRIRIGSW
ncbi:tail fiber protein [Escherichia phage EP335]|uniref:Putative tail fiber protein n=1 Tax=Escherichia phage EP335 TaxID=2070199 RepID=A0A2Z3DNR8_9CAUD|nr:tail fiber protein [Escherichia phage EP335]AVZ45101.1 putative tail fiber protein [Escherichia phage EP335]